MAATSVSTVSAEPNSGQTPGTEAMRLISLNGGNGIPYAINCNRVDFALRMSRAHRAYFRELFPPNPARKAEFAAEAAESLERQARTEASDDVSFDEYLRRYFAT